MLQSGCSGLLLSAWPAAASAPPSSLLEPLFSSERLSWPGPSLSYLRVLCYPSWLFGEWAASSRLASFTTPLGPRFAPATAVAAAAADTGKDVAFSARFYATLPDSFDNSVRVALGALPRSSIVADRAFNTKSLTEATLRRPGSVAEVAYDLRASPNRLSLTYSGSGSRRAELFLSALRSDPVDTPGGSDAGDAGSVPHVFCTAECTRQAAFGGGPSGRGGGVSDVADFLILCRFERDAADPGLVTLRQRVGVFLNPQDNQYFQAANQAVGIYDYDCTLRRVATPDGSGGVAVCVETPKGVTQCV